MYQGACDNRNTSCITARIERVDRVGATLTKTCDVGGVRYMNVTPNVVWVSTEIITTVGVESNTDWIVE